MWYPRADMVEYTLLLTYDWLEGHSRVKLITVNANCGLH